jgi:hypothetical protein
MASLQTKVAAQKMAEEQERVRKLQEEMQRERQRKEDEEKKRQEEEDTRKKYEQMYNCFFFFFFNTKTLCVLILIVMYFRKSEMEVRRKVEESERKRLEEADKIIAVKLQVLVSLIKSFIPKPKIKNFRLKWRRRIPSTESRSSRSGVITSWRCASPKRRTARSRTFPPPSGGKSPHPHHLSLYLFVTLRVNTNRFVICILEKGFF